jgi:hypothetical protein
MAVPGHSNTQHDACTDIRCRWLSQKAVLYHVVLQLCLQVLSERENRSIMRPLEALRKAGCKKIFENRVSGARAERPGLTQAREGLRAGDTLVVWKLDRLGRSVKHLIDLLASCSSRESSSKA